MKEIEEWWSNKTNDERQKIAYKAYINHFDDSAETLWQYPNCNTWWTILTDEEKRSIKDTCDDK